MVIIEKNHYLKIEEGQHCKNIRLDIISILFL